MAIVSCIVSDKRLESEIRRARANVGKKLARIAKREHFSPEVMRILDPRRNHYLPHMDTKGKRDFLKTLKGFTARTTNYYRDADGKPITQQQWDQYKKAEKAANAFVEKDVKRFAKIKMPIGDLTIGERQERLRPKPGILIANPSGSGMFLTNRNPSDVVSGNLPSLIESLNRRLDKDYISSKSFEGRSQFDKMMDVIGDNDLAQSARNLSDDQFWALWNYTDFANTVSLNYSLMMEGLRTGLAKDTALGISSTSKDQAHRYVEWASKIKGTSRR